MHLSSMFSSKKDSTILIKSCLHNELPEAVRAHSRALLKELALEELEIAKLGIEVSDVRLEAGVDKLEELGNDYLVAYHYDKPVGLLLSRKTDNTEIMALHVTQDYRNQGIGKLLVQQFVRINRLRTVKVVCMTVNTPALNFYKKLKFVFDDKPTLLTGFLTVD